MSLIGDIIGKIIHPSKSSGKTAPPTAQTVKSATTGASSSQRLSEVDIVNVLANRAREHSESLNWQTSIVDLLKVLDLDSSLKARKQLARELNYKGDMSDSAAMNMWLQKEVMKKLAESGGKVPPELMHS